MQLKECLVRRDNAATEFADHESRQHAAQLVNGLSYGLTTLRDLLFQRIHRDVEKNFGLDSMLMPVSPLKMETKVKAEIEIFQIAESAVEAAASGYVAEANWYCDWLATLRLGDVSANSSVQRRLERYLTANPDGRRLAFSNILEKMYPEARRAPMVLYRIFPLAIKIATSVAFGDHLHAAQFRNKQLKWLPAIQDCYECHGRVLDNGEKCQICGNPVWYFQWLTATG